MPTWPSTISGGGKIFTGASNAGGAPASLNTKGAWSVIVTSAPYDCILFVEVSPASPGSYLFDIGVGASGSEVVVVSNLLLSNGALASSPCNNGILIPLLIPKGSRISSRYQKSTTYSSSTMAIHTVPAYPGFTAPFSRCDTDGALTATSLGTVIDPGSSLGVKGSWVQLSSGVARRVKAITLAIGGQGNTSRINTWWNVDIGTGADPTNNIVLANYAISCSSYDSNIRPGVSFPLPVDLPESTPVHVRASCQSSTSTSYRTFDASIYLFS